MTAALIGAHPAAGDTVPPPTFSSYQLYPTALLPRSVATGDVNGDGRTDVVMLAGRPAGDYRATNDNTLVVFTGLPGGSLAQAYALPVDDQTAGTVDLALGDLDGDNATDAVVAVPDGLALFYQRGGVLTSGGLVAEAPADERTVAIADMNGDGRPDLVAATGTDTFVLTQRPDGGYDTRYVGDMPLYTQIAVGDLNGDGRPDIAGMAGNYDVQLSLQRPDGSFAERTIAADSIWDMSVGDVTGDGRPDVVVGAGNSDLNSAVEAFPQVAGTGISQSPVTHPTSQIPFALAAGDLNADHTLDLAVLQAFNGRVGAFAQGPDGSLGKESLAPIPYQASFTPGSIAMGDLTGDGQPDLAVASGGDAPQGLVVVPQGPPAGGSPELFPGPPAAHTGLSAGPLPFPEPIVVTSPPVDSSHPNGGKPTRITSRRGLTNAGPYERYVAPRSRCPGSSSSRAKPAVLARAFTCLLAYARHRARIGKPVHPNHRLAGTATLKVKAILHCQDFDHDACRIAWPRLFHKSGYLHGRTGYRIGESIAYASDWVLTPRGILRVWLESPAHRRSLFDPRWRETGVSIARGRLQGERVAVWALEFGARGRR
jgi:uncharacterized protein YkwD